MSDTTQSYRSAEVQDLIKSVARSGISQAEVAETYTNWAGRYDEVTWRKHNVKPWSGNIRSCNNYMYHTIVQTVPNCSRGF